MIKISYAITYGTDLKTHLKGRHLHEEKGIPSPFSHELAGGMEKVGDCGTSFEGGHVRFQTISHRAAIVTIVWGV